MKKSTASNGAPQTRSVIAPTASSVPKQRVALWDNARFILIALVVMGHLISTIRTGTHTAFAFYGFAYLFHMPAFILLAGYFSRAEVNSRAIRSTLQLLVTWVVWELIWGIIRTVSGSTPFGKNAFVIPSWTLWFLVSLATMRILLPYIARFRHPLLLSFALALVGGFSTLIGTEFSAARTLCLLPFFVGGWLVRERGWLNTEWFLRPSVALRAVGVAIFAAFILLFAFWLDLGIDWRIDHWLFWNRSYASALEEAPFMG